jgi:hypothetical protein
MIKKLSTMLKHTEFYERSQMDEDQNIDSDDLFQISISGPPELPYSKDGWATASVTFDSLAKNMKAEVEDPRDLRSIKLEGNVEDDHEVIVGNNGDHQITFKADGAALKIFGDNNSSTITISGTDKYAIVPSMEGDFVSLVCVESPETRFEDIIVMIPRCENDVFLASMPIDPEFLFVCEPNTIEAISSVSDEPAIMGVKIENDMIIVKGKSLFNSPKKITVKISGIRKGRLGKRFTHWTEEQAKQNTQFWSEWETKSNKEKL